MFGRSRSAAGRLRGRALPHPSAAATVRKRDRGTPPNVVGKGPLLAASGLDLGIVVIARDEAPHLPEWLAYHHALGVQHVFLYDNGSRDAIDEVLEPWINHGLVTLMRWPLPGGQLDAYAHALRFFGPSVTWLAFVDVDEFIVPLVDADIPSLLARWPEAADVRVPRVDFGFSGHRSPPDGLTIEAFTGVADVFARDASKPPRVKTIARSRRVSAVGIHTATVPPGEQQTVGARACEGLVQLNHYYTRSFEEFEAKRFRGSATGRITRPAIPFDLPTLRVDTSAVRYAEPTRVALALMGSLAPRPYHYGSQLALEQFPRFNDLGLFAELAIANVVAEEPEPRREPRIRLENQFGGTGFLARLPQAGDSLEPREDADPRGSRVSGRHQPRRGDLSLSPHLAPLLERTRGRLEASWAVSAEAATSTLRAGALEARDDGWRLAGSAAETAAEIIFDIDADGQRRCLAVGFVVSIEAPITLHMELEAAEAHEVAPLELMLGSSGTYAGVVELASRPLLVRKVMMRVHSAPDVLVHDLFVISYG